MKKTIVYLICQPLDKRNFDRFGIALFRDRGWDVRVWDLTPYIYPKIWKSGQLGLNPALESPAYQVIFSFPQLVILLEKTEARIYVDIVNNLEPKYLKLLRQLHKKETYRLQLNLGSIPLPAESLFSRRRIAVLLKKPQKLLNFARVYLIGKKIDNFNQAFRSKLLIAVGGEYSYDDAFRRTLNESQIIKAHNFDYDRFLAEKQNTSIDECPFFLFVDQDLAFHIDLLYMGEEPSITVENYYPAIYKALTTISSTLNIPVKIAAHPRSGNRLIEEKLFRDLPVMMDSTARLINKCRFVVCHTSTASQLAILFKKPIIFMTTDEMELQAIGLGIANLAKLLGKSQVINIDGDLASVDWEKELAVNDEQYEFYKRKYIKMLGSGEAPLWDIIEKYLIQKCYND